MDKYGFTVFCPTRAIAKRIYDFYLLNGARESSTIIKTGFKNHPDGFCLCYDYRDRRMLWGSLEFHREEGLDDWNLYMFSNDIEDILLKNEGRVITCKMDS